MTIYANKPTPTGRTSGFAISRPSADHAWRDAKPIIERLHCFGKLSEAAPKHHYTKGAGDTDYIGRANGGLSADFELKGEVGFSGMRSLLEWFFGNPNVVPTVIVAGKAFLYQFELPRSPLLVATICHYDGVGRFVEIPSAMITSFSIEAKSDSMFTWSCKGVGDMLRENEACLNSPVDMDNAPYASGAYSEKYVAHDASEDSTVDLNRFGRTQLRRVPAPADFGLDEVDFTSEDEIPWSDFKLTMDLKAAGVASQRRSKSFPAITDIPDVKIEMGIPTEGDSVDTNHGWADLIDEAFLEGGNRDVPQYPIFNKFYMELCGPRIPDLPNDTYLAQNYLMKIRCPRLSARVMNPSAAASGLEPVKADMVAMREVHETPIGIPGKAPIYVDYQTDQEAPPVGVPLAIPVIDNIPPLEGADTAISGTSGAAQGTIVTVYVDNLEFGQAVVQVGGVWSVTEFYFTTDLSTYVGKTITARQGFGETKSAATAGIIVAP